MPHPLLLLLIGAAGGLGAVCRAGLDRLVQRLSPTQPIGIFTVNVLASAVIGVLAALGLTGALATESAGSLLGSGSETLGPIFATGLIGGFSTFSTVAVDTALLGRARRWFWVALNSAGMLAVSGAVCVGTYALSRMILG